MDDIAVRVEGISKDFVLPHERATTLKSVFTNLAKGNRSWRKKETLHALKGVNFKVNKGEFFGIVGRNGSGKSTLLKILAGIYQPTSGKVHIQGKLVPFIELGVGFNQELSGRENVYLNGAILGFSRRQIDAIYDDVVAFAELGEFMDQKLKNYSSGMQVRLAFSMATRSEADILLIDEVLAVGDADFQRKCFEYFKLLKKNKKTVVFVSHDMEAIREYCDRAILIDDSEIKIDGSTSEVTREYAKLFIVDKSERTEDAAGKNRWGDGRITVTKISATADDDKVIITTHIVAHSDIKQPIIGFRLRDAAGKEITGTNTKIEQITTPNLKAGEALKLSWEMPNIFSDGSYLIDPAILHNDAITVADWWDDALRVTVKKGRHLSYAVDPSFSVYINKL